MIRRTFIKAAAAVLIGIARPLEMEAEEVEVSKSHRDTYHYTVIYDLHETRGWIAEIRQYVIGRPYDGTKDVGVLVYLGSAKGAEPVRSKINDLLDSA